MKKIKARIIQLFMEEHVRVATVLFILITAFSSALNLCFEYSRQIDIFFEQNNDILIDIFLEQKHILLETIVSATLFIPLLIAFLLEAPIIILLDFFLFPFPQSLEDLFGYSFGYFVVLPSITGAFYAALYYLLGFMAKKWPLPRS